MRYRDSKTQKYNLETQFASLDKRSAVLGGWDQEKKNHDGMHCGAFTRPRCTICG
jgi:hypothetical protein